MRKIKKMAFWLGFLLTIIYVAVIAIDIAWPELYPPQFKKWCEPIPGLLVAILAWNIVTIVDSLLTNDKVDQKLESVETKNKETFDAANKSLSLLHDITLRLKDYSGLTPIAVGVSNMNNFFIYLPFYVANKFKFFEQEDLKVTLKSFKNDDKAFEALLNAEYQFAITDPGMIINNIGSGRIIAPLVTKVAVWGLSKKSIVIPSNLSAVVTYPKPSTAFEVVKHWLESKGLSEGIIKQLSADEIVNQSDEIVRHYDLICVTEPERSWFEKKYTELSFSIDFHKELYKEEQFNFTAILTTQRELEYNQEVVKRFLKALRLSYNLIYAALPNTPTYNQITEAAKDSSISTYPSKLGHDLDIDMARRIFEQLRSNLYFSKTVVYNSEQKRGLINAIKLRQSSLPATLTVNSFVDSYLIDAQERFQLTV